MMQSTPIPNPYVGPRTFTYAQRQLFFGREREARDLLARVLSERLLLFYAQSGAGKSSLLHTRLIPQLQEEKAFVVLPVARVNGALPAGIEQVDNLHVFNLMLSLDEGDDPGRLAQVTLTDFLARLTCRTLTDDTGQAQKSWIYDASLTPAAAAVSPNGRRYALIIDQFEEIITANPARWHEREDFFRQLDQALRHDPNLWVVLTLREDYVASLDPYAPLLADRLRARFYMERMDVVGALTAVRNPAAEFGRPFASGVAEKLVDDLRQVRMAGQETAVLGQYVEPVQLQVVCYQLWERLLRGAAEATHDEAAAGDAAIHNMISEVDLAAAGDVNQSLEDFYSETLAAVLNAPEIKQSGLSERALRTWFDRELITETGIRNTVFRNEAAGRTGSLPNAAVDALVRRFLLRTELRAGGAWLELIHDRFVQPIQTANRAWFTQNRNPLTQWAAEWREAGKPVAQLLRGERLQEARAQVDSRPGDFSDIEREFLAAGVAAERRRLSLLRFGTAAALVFVVSALFIATAHVKTKNASVLSQVFRAQSALARGDPPEQSALLSVSAIRDALDWGGVLQPVDSLDQLVRTLASLGGVPLRAHQGIVNTVAFNPQCRPDAAGIAVDACRMGLASGGDDHSLRLWDIRDPLPTSIKLEGHSAAVKLVAFSPDGRWLASGSADHTMRLWDLTASPPKAQVFSVGGDFMRLEFSPKGRWLVAATQDATVRLWDMSKAPEIAAPQSLQQTYREAVNAVFSRDEQRLMTASRDGLAGEIRLWRADDGFAQSELINPGYYIAQATLSPDGAWLAVSTDRLNQGTELRYVGPEKTAPADKVQLFPKFVYAYMMAFSDDSRSFSTNGFLWRLNDAGRWSEPVRMVGQPQDGVSAPHFSGDGRWLASASADYTVYRWDLADLTRLPYVYRGHEGGINDLAFNADASLLASAGADGVVRLWQAAAPTAGPTLLHQPDEPIEVRLWDAAAADPARSPRVIGRRPDNYRLLAISADGRYIALGYENGSDEVLLWDTTQPVAEPLRLRHPGTVEAMKFGPACTRSAAADQCHSWLAVGDWSGNLRLWDMNNPTADGFAFVDLPHGAALRDLAFSADGRLLVTGVGSPDSWGQYQVNVWPLNALTAPVAPARLLRGHTSIIRTVAVSASGRWVLSGAWEPDLTARLWDLNQSGDEPVATLNFTGRPFAAAFSPDERWAAAASWDATAQLVRLDAPYAPPIVLAQHRNRILSMAISPDSHWLATGGEDRRIILWDLTAPDPSKAFAVLRSPTGSGSGVQVAFSADNRWLAAFGAAAFSSEAARLVTADNDVHLYNLQTDEAIERICLAVGRTTDPEPNAPMEDESLNACPQPSENPLAKRLRAQALRAEGDAGKDVAAKK